MTDLAAALAGLEAVIDRSGVAPRIEAMLPTGVRPRQLSVRTLLAGMCLPQANGRPAHLTRVHQALTALPGHDRSLASGSLSAVATVADQSLVEDRSESGPFSAGGKPVLPEMLRRFCRPSVPR